MLDDLESGEEIGKITARLLKEAGCNRRPPTRIQDVVAAARLIQAPDSLFSESALRDVPEHLAAKVRPLMGRVRAAFDRRQRVIYVNANLAHDGRRRFVQLHEVVHGVLPWQQETAYVDTGSTLSWATRNRFEQEANQGSAELLFQRNFFTEMAADYQIGFGGVFELADKFQASYHASFRRYVETHRGALAGVVLEQSPCAPGGVYRRKEACNSPAWADRYERPAIWPRELAPTPYAFVADLYRLGGDVPVALTFDYPDLNNEITTLHVEMWSNSYNAFVLMWVPARETLKRRRIVLQAAAAA